jgi:hypothetical protein
MSIVVCLTANTLHYPQGGGHQWVFLNWALGLRALGCQVIWLEAIRLSRPMEQVQANLEALKRRLEPYGLRDSIALYAGTTVALPRTLTASCLDIEAAVEAELLLSFRYGMVPEVVARFRRSALIDIDPGLLQLWISTGKLVLPRHDVYFTIGETVGQRGALFPDCALPWQYTPPCVALDWWPPHWVPEGAPYTTVSHWNMREGMYDGANAYSNDKRTGFLPFLDLPKYTSQKLELALCLAPDEEHERMMLRDKGWEVRNAWEVACTPQDYQHYIQNSRGEFSCVKPSCVRLQNAWISDRTLCYLASGKPAVVEYTGPSRFLPDMDGLLRFRNRAESVAMLAAAETEYDRHCRAARNLAEEYFDAKKVVKGVLERSLA